jgi:cell division protein FtsN
MSKGDRAKSARKRGQSYTKRFWLVYVVYLVLGLVGGIVVVNLLGKHINNYQQQWRHARQESKALPKQQFDFYTMLLQNSPKVSDAKAIDANSDSVRKLQYWLELAYFVNLTQAEANYANLMLVGIESVLDSNYITNDGQRLYRLLLGPYAQEQEAERERLRIQKLSVTKHLTVKIIEETIKKD